MAFNDSYITSAGENLLSAAAGGETITWIRAATSSYDVDSLTPAQMRALESIVQNNNQYTGSGNVSSHIVNNNTLTASINCQITNNTYENGGPANLFGVWAKTDTTYTSEVLVFVARRGGGAQTTISSKTADPLFTLFVNFGIRIDEFENPANVQLTITNDYYATSTELATETTAREDFDLRTVTSHSSYSDTSGDDQDIYGVKTFKNNTEHSGNILPTANSLNIGEDSTDGRWNTVYASTFNGTTFTGTTFTGTTFTGNAATATDATNLSYISGSTITQKLSADSTQVSAKDDIVPSTTNSYDLGSTSSQWRNIYVSGSGGSNGYIVIGNSNAGNTYPMIRPSQDGKCYLGYTGYNLTAVYANRFEGGKFNGTLVEDTAHSIFGIVEDGSTGPFYNGTCNTAASTTTKVVTCSGFTLAIGAVITVLFTKSSSLASSASLNVNSTGARPIVAGSDVATWSAQSLKTFRYNGAEWVAIKTNMVSNYGVCSTASDDSTKLVTISNSSFRLEKGARVIVKFTYYNSASYPYLNVNSTGAKRIKKYSTVDPGGTAFDSWINDSTLEFVYDGTYWVWLGYQYYAGSSSYVGILGNANSSSYPLVFTSSVNTSTTDRVNRTLYTDTANSLYYNPSSNTLTCTTFSGSLSGNASSATTATYADTVKTTQDSSSATQCPIVFTSAYTNDTYKSLNTSSSSNGLYYTPSTSQLHVQNLVIGNGIASSVKPYTASVNYSIGASNNRWYYLYCKYIDCLNTITCDTITCSELKSSRLHLYDVILKVTNVYSSMVYFGDGYDLVWDISNACFRCTTFRYSDSYPLSESNKVKVSVYSYYLETKSSISEAACFNVANIAASGTTYVNGFRFGFLFGNRIKISGNSTEYIRCILYDKDA